MNDWELTDGEIFRAAIEQDKFIFMDAEDVSEPDRAIATAAQKKLVEWLTVAMPMARDFNGESLWPELRGPEWEDIKVRLGVK